MAEENNQKKLFRGEKVDLARMEEDEKSIYKFIEKLAERDDIFVGIRGDYLNVYYMGGSAGKIKQLRNSRGYSGVIKAEVHKRYLGEEFEKNKEYRRFSSDEKDPEKDFSRYVDVLDSKDPKGKGPILEGIKEHQLKKLKDEKVCQQWIINQTNEDKNSDWYYLDMEYSKEYCPTGRFDMIAISRNKHNGKYKVALVELKVGVGSYGGISTEVGDKLKEKLKKTDIYDLPKEESVACGSGIVGHMIKFLRFLNDGHYETDMKNDIVGILKQHLKLGLLDENWDITKDINGLTPRNLSKEEYQKKEKEFKKTIEKPEVYIVSYNKAPGMEIKQYYSKNITTSLMKKTMHKYLFSDPVDGKDASKYALERVLENSDTAGVLKEMKEEISSGLLNTDPKRNSKLATSDSMDLKLENLEAKISVGKENHKTDYTFHFVFVDNENDDKWDCLKKPEKSK